MPFEPSSPTRDIVSRLGPFRKVGTGVDNKRGRCHQHDSQECPLLSLVPAPHGTCAIGSLPMSTLKLEFCIGQVPLVFVLSNCNALCLCSLLWLVCWLRLYAFSTPGRTRAPAHQCHSEAGSWFETVPGRNRFGRGAVARFDAFRLGNLNPAILFLSAFGCALGRIGRLKRCSLAPVSPAGVQCQLANFMISASVAFEKF